MRSVTPARHGRPCCEGETWQGNAKQRQLWGVAYNGSDRETVYMAREDGCACRSIRRAYRAVGMVCWYRLKEQTGQRA